MTPYIENPKNSTKKLLEMVSKCNKVAGYRIDIQRPVVFLFTNNELSERETNNPFTVASKKKKNT